MRNVFAVTAALALLGSGIAAQANINIETVAIRDAGNAADTTGYGSVGYNYNIGKYEVTTKQYADFLNNKAKSDPYGLYNTSMTSLGGCNIQRVGTSGSYTYSVADDWANRPVNCVSYWDACRFANWLGNGQGTGSTETCAYALNGYNGTDGREIQRNAGATWAVTSEDEWYKAAYYKSGGTNAGYWGYPTQSNDVPANLVDLVDPGNSANYTIWSPYYGILQSIGSPYFRSNVGEFENSASAYGTFDQGGNVSEWNEAIMTGAYRGLRGGYFSGDIYGNELHASSRYDSYHSLYAPTFEATSVGFRVSEVPEPSSMLALLCGVGGLSWFRKRKS